MALGLSFPVVMCPQGYVGYRSNNHSNKGNVVCLEMFRDMAMAISL